MVGGKEVRDESRGKNRERLRRDGEGER
jgi:hypothetical protein